MIRFTRAGGDEPADNEEVVIEDDGPARSERSVAGGRIGRIGRFERRLDSAARDALARAAAAAAAAGPRGLRSRPHDAIETIVVGDVSGEFDPHGTPDDAWGPLLTILRGLLDDAAAKPRAGLALRVAPDGRSATLERLGAGETTIGPGAVAIEARIIRDGMVARNWPVAAPAIPASLPAGWSVTFDLEPPEKAGDGYIEVAVDLAAGFEGPPAPRRVIAAT